MKKIVLLALNAKYFHTNLAVRCLKAAAGEMHDIEIIERTINDDMELVMEEIAACLPDAVGFSCYIWNIEHVLLLASDIKKLLPACFIFMGGPETSFDCVDFMKTNPFADMVIKGEGEITFCRWMEAFEADNDFTGLCGATVRQGSKIHDNPPREQCFDLDSLPFIYNDLSEYENKIIYFETSRGCPMRCAYCMSGQDGGMSYMDIDKVRRAFEHFLKNDVRQVKLVDRTFNYPLERAKKILSMLLDLKKEYPYSGTNFHFEITASIMDGEFMEIIKKAPEGLIQVEAGVQSTYPETLGAISRNVDTEKLLRNIKATALLGNITVYADLIAGLPLESYADFTKSFNDVYALNTQKIHLGFLKVLKGSAIKNDAEAYGIVYSEKAPYKVLETRDISYLELRKLEKIEKLVELYKNSGNFDASEKYAANAHETPFGFYEKFAQFANDTEFFSSRQGIAAQFDTLYDFMAQSGKADINEFKDLLLFDWAMMEKPRRYPKRLEPKTTEKGKAFARAFYNNPENIERYLPEYVGISPSAVSRMCHIVYLENTGRHILFDYGRPKKKRAADIT